jgi:hypothetical protein
MCVLVSALWKGEDILPAHLPNNLGGVSPGVCERTRDR